MNSSIYLRKRSAGIFALLVFFLHICCTILYITPENPVSKNYKGLVHAYMEPLFNQNWLLFAPEPATNALKLWYRCKSNGMWTHWMDPGAAILEEHQKLRSTPNGKLYYIYGNIARDICKDYELLLDSLQCEGQSCHYKVEKELIKGESYKLGLRYAKRNYNQLHPHELNVDSIQIMIIQLYPKQYSERLSPKPFSAAKSIEFSPLSYHHY